MKNSNQTNDTMRVGITETSRINNHITGNVTTYVEVARREHGSYRKSSAVA